MASPVTLMATVTCLRQKRLAGAPIQSMASISTSPSLHSAARRFVEVEPLLKSLRSRSTSIFARERWSRGGRRCLRGRRDRERDPRIPAGWPVLPFELAVALEVQVALHGAQGSAHRKDDADLRADADHT